MDFHLSTKLKSVFHSLCKSYDIYIFCRSFTKFYTVHKVLQVKLVSTDLGLLQTCKSIVKDVRNAVGFARLTYLMDAEAGRSTSAQRQLYVFFIFITPFSSLKRKDYHLINCILFGQFDRRIDKVRESVQ